MTEFETNVLPNSGFSRVTVFVVALETFRKSSKGSQLPSKEFAHADGEAIAATFRDMYSDLPQDVVSIHLLKDADASISALRDDLSDAISTLDQDDLFIMFYAGHGFHGSHDNHLCAFDTNPTHPEGTSLSLQADLLKPLMKTSCAQVLLFIDASAEALNSADASCRYSNLNSGDIHDTLTGNTPCCVFLSCSMAEETHSSKHLMHSVWANFLITALTGRAADALKKDRWLTDVGLQKYLGHMVPQFITREMKIRGTQSPQAILSRNDPTPIHHMPLSQSKASNTALAGITLQNNSEFLEGTETGVIRRLPGVTRGFSKAPSSASASVNSWCQRLLAERVSAELQDLYQSSRKAMNARRKDVQKAEDTGAGDLDTAAFRYSIETGQNPDDPAEFFIRRRLELRQDWDVHRSAIDEIFGSEFDCLVVEFEKMDDTFDDLVDRLEDIQDEHGGDITDDDQTKRATLVREGVTYTFDLIKRRLEISFGRTGTLKLIDAAQDIQLGTSRPSPMLAS